MACCMLLILPRLRHAAAADAGTSIRHAAAEAAATIYTATDAAQPFAIKLPMLPLLHDYAASDSVAGAGLDL
jgi:hypothetical protein